MNVIVLNGSPLMERGNTALILNSFVEGIREAGAEVSVHYTRQLHIEPCRGEHHCWYKHLGRCSLEDDMQPLYAALKNADLWVLATPVYSDGMAAPLKNLLDRVIPLLHPFFEIRDGHCRHPLLEKRPGGRIALVATCGLWEMDSFSPLLAMVKGICRNCDRQLAGALLRPHSQALKPLMKQGNSLDDVFAAAREAGRQVVQHGEIAFETASTVGRRMISKEDYVSMINEKFARLLSPA